MNEMHSSPQDHEDVLRELFLRFAILPEDRRSLDLQLFVGKIPEDLPFTLPLSEGSVLLGSFSQGAKYVEIALDTPLSPRQALQFYRTHLLASGWEEAQYHLSSFMPMDKEGTLLFFTQYASSVKIRVDSRQGNLTAIRVTFDRGTERDDPIAMRLHMIASTQNKKVPYLVPRLEAPAEAELRNNTRQMLFAGVQNNATLVTSLELPALVTHYATQLKQARWTHTGEGMNEFAAWQTWTFRDEEQEIWVGRFFFLRMPDKPQEYYLYMQVTK